MRFYILYLLISIATVLEIYSQQNIININDNPAAGYLRATWYASPAFFLVDNDGFNRYANDNTKMQNYIKYLGKNRWMQVVADTYYIYNENLEVIDSIPNPYRGNMHRMIDWHDVVKLSNGNYLLLLYDTRTMDLSKIVEGGKPDATIIGNMLVEADRTGKIYWEWTVFDHFEITDLVDFYDLTMNIIDFTHINSIQETSDGNLVLSVRNFDEVVKIKKSDGSVIWRIGGSKSKKNQFSFTNDTRNGFTGFSHQHSAQILPNGNLLLLDNGVLNPLKQTRAVEYQLDLTNKKATKVWEYFHPDEVFAPTMGSVEILPNGNRFVNFGRKFITEVRPDGSVAWELEYKDGNGLYHATRVIEYMDAVYRNVGSIGNYSFNDNDYNTGVELQITSIQGKGDVSVEKHRYLPTNRKFEDTSYTELMPFRYVINQYGISNFNGTIKFNTSTIPQLLYPTKARLYWREKEGVGEFKEIQCTYNPNENVIEAQINKFGEFVVGVSVLSKPNIITPSEFISVPINTILSWTKVNSAQNYQVKVSSQQNMTNLITDTIIKNTELLIKNLRYNTTYYWQVRSMNDKDTSQWSNVSGFTTLISAPILAYPANQVNGFKAKDLLKWYKVEGAESYKVELANNQTFTDIANVFIGITDTNISISNIKHNKRYYWRVFAIKGKDTVVSQMTFSFVTIMVTPIISIPKNNSINVSLPAKFEWNNVDGAELYLVQISENLDFANNFTIADSSRTPYITLKELEFDRTYYWRVRAARSTDSSEWSEIYKFRTELATPILFYPLNNAENIEINPVLKWKDIYEQVLFKIQVSKSSDFSNSIIDTICSLPYLPIRELKNNTLFYWRVKTVKNEYQSSWSETFSFKTGNNFIVQEPFLVSPRNNAIVDVPVTLIWTQTNGAIKYRIQISQNSNFNTIEQNVETLKAEYIFNTETKQNNYYWRVKAYSTYDSSKWSDVWMLKPYYPNQKISLLSPKNAELQVRTTDTLIWQPVVGADYYILEVATNKDFIDNIISESNLQTNRYVFTDFQKGKQYYWRVKCSIKGRENIWSNVWSFTVETNNLLNTPKMVFPKNNLVGFYVDGKLEWEKVPEARYYRLTIAKDTLFDELVSSIITSDTYYQIVKNLDFAENYYWKVASLSEISTSKWSNVYTFTTELEPPQILKPYDLETNVDLIAELIWNETKNSKFYTLQLSSDKEFKSNLQTMTNLSDTKIKVELQKDKTYYSRIKAQNYENQSRWSSSFAFSTGDNIVGISNDSNREMIIYPNPVKHILNIYNYSPIDKIYLIDILGNQIDVKIVNNQIDLSHLTSGLYILKIGNSFYKLIKE